MTVKHEAKAIVPLKSIVVKDKEVPAQIEKSITVELVDEEQAMIKEKPYSSDDANISEASTHIHDDESMAANDMTLNKEKFYQRVTKFFENIDWDDLSK